MTDKIKRTDFDSLYQILMQEISIYNELLELIQKKQMAIVASSIADLDHCTANEQQLVKKANALADARIMMINKIMGEKKIKADQPALRLLLKTLEEPKKSEWTAMENHLTTTLGEINRVNQENRRLLETSLDLIRESIRIFLPEQGIDGQLYDKDGAISSAGEIQKVLNCQI